MSLAAIPTPFPRQTAEERVVTVYGMTWERFREIARGFTGIASVRLTYIDGILEIMSPVGPEHENIKSTLGLLLETYMREKGIRFYRRGGFTLVEEGRTSGEPDESYCIGSDKAIPDIVIEVIVTSGSLDKRALYLPKSVPEVWFWQANAITLFRLQGEGEERCYRQVERSRFFPDLDPALLANYLDNPDQYDAVKAFQAALGGAC